MIPTLSANPLDLRSGDLLVKHPIKAGLAGQWKVMDPPSCNLQTRIVDVPVVGVDGKHEVIPVPMGVQVIIAGPTNGLASATGEEWA